VAGLYLHIPFCRKLCFYCDFHFTVSLKDKERLVKALISELRNRKSEAEGIPIETIYLGGGTPSVLAIDELNGLFQAISENYAVSASPEITLEANPDDLTSAYLENIRKSTPVNRLSIGIQSFIDRDLLFLNRRHTAKEGFMRIKTAQEFGFTNLNIDLIYGIPGMSLTDWETNLRTFLELDLPHLSAYHLTIETKTVFGHYLKKGKITPVDETISMNQFELLMAFSESHGYDHYEISNLAKPGFYSKHNLAYWTGKPYIGIGPSAHSYSGNQRRWNISNNTRYCEALERKTTDYFETETIDTDTAYNEYLLTALRTKWGIDTRFIKENFGLRYFDLCRDEALRFIQDGTLLEIENYLILSTKGKFLADFVISAMMIVH
jgi:oxygen-independent coproporphyrinogen III oxidase